MQDYIFKISTRRWGTSSLLFCMLVCVWLTATNYAQIGRTPPEVLFVFCALALLIGWKTVYVGFDKLCLRYNLILLRRTIPIERVSSVEIVIKDQVHTLLLTLDNCTSFKNDRTSSYNFYILKHPIKVISIQCSRKDAFKCKEYFEANHVHTDVIFFNRTGDGLREP